MAAVNIRHFDTLEFVKHSKSLGVDEPIAEYQARQIEQAIDIAVNTAHSGIELKDLATKNNLLELRQELKTDIFEVKNEINELRQDVKNLEISTKKDITELEMSTKIDMKDLELRLTSQIHKSKTETVGWISGIMVTLLVASGLIQHFFK